METLNLEIIRDGFPGLTPAAGGYLLEACIACLIRQNHQSGVELKVEGMVEKKFRLTWSVLFDLQLDRTWKDQNSSTECGALCLAMLLVHQLTEYTIFAQASPGTGFDYYLLKKKNIGHVTEDWVYDAILEISGIFNGTHQDLNRRFQLKIRQTDRSHEENRPVFVCVVEFSFPQTRFERIS